MNLLYETPFETFGGITIVPLYADCFHVNDGFFLVVLWAKKKQQY